MAAFRYFSHGQQLTFASSAGPAGGAASMGGRRGAAAAPMAGILRSTAASKAFVEPPTAADVVAATDSAGNVIVATHTAILDSPTEATIKWMRDKHGFEVVRRGTTNDALVLMAAPEGGRAGVEQTFAATAGCYRKGGVAAAHPNFVRSLRQVRKLSPSVPPGLWHLDNDGSVGVAGADVHAKDAWKITRGRPEVRVAVLDEGVDSRHPALPVVAEYDAVDHNAHARPSNDDAHGTACAGIIASRDTKVPGLAPRVSIVGVRIAKDDGQGNWVFDDFDVADAIDWAWRDGKADVLSNSWGGGPPADAITRAFERARKKGRGGRGCVIAVATGNDNGPVSYPATLKTVLAVGASNQWDQRKSPTSKDGEDWWGSNFGTGLDIMAPGVAIRTTDIVGARGYSSGGFVNNFNGTSSATPHVAAAAALLLSHKPSTTEARVRRVLCKTADPIGTAKTPNTKVGHGRLNAHAALLAV